MPNRTFVDKLIGRHYCPVCGQSAGFKQEHSKTKVPRWYQLAPTEFVCNACGATVEPSIRSGIWPSLFLLLTLSLAVFVALEKLGTADLISPSTARFGQFSLVGILLVVGPYLIQHFLVYNSAPKA